MSLHPSLRIDAAGVQQRTVLSRIERIKDLMKKGLWNENQPITGLPKSKIVRIKAKKTKTKEEAAGAPADAAKPGANKASAAKAPAAKEAKSAK